MWPGRGGSDKQARKHGRPRITSAAPGLGSGLKPLCINVYIRIRCAPPPSPAPLPLSLGSVPSPTRGPARAPLFPPFLSFALYCVFSTSVSSSQSISLPSPFLVLAPTLSPPPSRDRQHEGARSTRVGRACDHTARSLRVSSQRVTLPEADVWLHEPRVKRRFRLLL